MVERMAHKSRLTINGSYDQDANAVVIDSGILPQHGVRTLVLADSPLIHLDIDRDTGNLVSVEILGAREQLPGPIILQLRNTASPR